MEIISFLILIGLLYWAFKPYINHYNSADNETQNLISIGLLYFLGMYFILFNFPIVGIFVSSKQHYIEDLDNEKYRAYCIALQNLFMSILFGIMVDTFYMRQIQNESIINIFAIILFKLL